MARTCHICGCNQEQSKMELAQLYTIEALVGVRGGERTRAINNLKKALELVVAQHAEAEGISIPDAFEGLTHGDVKLKDEAIATLRSELSTTQANLRNLIRCVEDARNTASVASAEIWEPLMLQTVEFRKGMRSGS